MFLFLLANEHGYFFTSTSCGLQCANDVYIQCMYMYIDIVRRSPAAPLVHVHNALCWTPQYFVQTGRMTTMFEYSTVQAHNKHRLMQIPPLHWLWSLIVESYLESDIDMASTNSHLSWISRRERRLKRRRHRDVIELVRQSCIITRGLGAHQTRKTAMCQRKGHLY